MRRHVLRFLALVLAAVVVVTLAGGGYLRVVLRRSLPVADGTLALAGLQQPVTVARDALGVPTIRAASRVDLARAVGFVHAQERFFQMDLQRRQPAGELSALVGAAALTADRGMRVHRFRHIAREALTFSPPEYMAELEAYAAGVNAGLAALAAPPFEYLALRTTPVPWTPEDSMLTAIAMSVTLQGGQSEYERTLGAMRDGLPGGLFEFLAGRASDWESPIVGDPHPVPPVPGPEEIDIRDGNVRGARAPGLRSRTRVRLVGRSRGPATRCRGGRGCRARKTPRSAATTGRCRVRARPPAARSSPTTCTCGCRCRTSGSAPPTRFPTIEGQGRRAAWSA